MFRIVTKYLDRVNKDLSLAEDYKDLDKAVRELGYIIEDASDWEDSPFIIQYRNSAVKIPKVEYGVNELVQILANLVAARDGIVEEMEKKL